MEKQDSYAGRVKSTGAQSVKALYPSGKKQHGTVRRGEDLRLSGTNKK